MIEGNTPISFTVGSIVTHADPYHRRGASTGAIELITDQGWYQIWWEEDENQIHPAARTYEGFELKPCLNSQ
jgi:hypothetical protein